MSNNGNKTVTLTVDVQAKLTDLQAQAKKMQDMLRGLKMPDDLSRSVKKEFDDLFASMRKAKELTEGNKIKLVDEKKIQEEYDAIEKGYKNLIRKLSNNSKKIGATDFKVFDALKGQIESYEKGIRSIKNAYESAEKALARYEAKSKVASDNLKEINSQKTELENFKKVYEEKKKIRDDYFKAKKNGEEWASEPQARAGWNKRKDHSDIDSFLEENKAKYEQIEAEIQKFTEEQEKAVKETDKASKAYENQQAVLDELKQKYNEAKASQLALVKEGLAKLQSEEGLKLGFDPSSLQSIDELEAKLKELNLWDNSLVTKTLEEFGVIAKKDAEDIQVLKESTNSSTEAFKEMDNTLEAFKKKATYFFGMANAVNLLRRAVQSAFNTVKDLDAVMTETAVVTDFSVGDMWAQLPEYTKRANELGVSIHDAYEAATLYYQQGLKTNEVIAVSNETLKMARIAGLGAAEATDRMTNALRGFNMEINEESAQRVNDVYSKLAAITAADTDEISTAMTKVASLAHNANMEFETTSAFLSQMIETTRESAETAGTALKTVIARFSEVKKLYNQGDLMGQDEEGEDIDVNKVSQALRSAGINLNEYLTGAKGLDDIFIELASKWEHLDMVQQRYIATMAAGSRQQSRFIAMMSDYKRTTQLVTAANTAAGASQKQFEKTLDSLQSKLAQLKNSWDTFLMGIADDTLIKGIIDILTKLIDVINKLFEVTDNIPIGGSVARIMGVVGALKLGQLAINKLIGQAGVLFGITNKQAIADMGLASAEASVIKQKEKEIAINQLSIFGLIKSVFARNAEAEATSRQLVMSWLNTKATRGNIAAKLALVVAEKAATMSGKKLAVVTGLLHLGLLAVGAAAIYAAYKLFKFLTASHGAKESLDDAQKSADAAAEAANQAAEAYDNLKNSMADLSDKTKALEDMVRGTKEWKEAVQEVNNEVLQLMQQYEDLRVVKEDGVLKIDQDSYNEALNKRFEQQNNAQAAMVGAQQKVAQLKVDVTYEDLDLDEYISEEYAKNYVERLRNGEMEAVKEELGSLSTILGDEDIVNEVVDKLLKYSEAIDKSIVETDEYSKVLAQVAVAQADVTKETEEYASNFSQNQIDNFRKEAEKEVEEEDLSNKEMRELVAQKSGYKDYDEYEEKTGKEISKKDAKEMYIAIKQRELATNSINAFAKNLDKLDPIFKAIYSREDTLGLNGKMLEKSSYDSEKAKTDTTGQANILLEEAQKYWDENSKELEEMYGDFDTFFIAYSKAIIYNNNAMDQAKQKYEELGGVLSTLSGRLSAGALSDLSDNLQLVFDAAGEEGAQIIQKDISDIISGMDSDEDAENFVNTLNSINWKSANALDSFKDTLEELGIEIPEQELNRLVNNIDNLAGAIRKVNLEEVTEQLEKFGALASKIKSGEQKSTGWSKEDMEAAVTAGIAQSDFYFDAETGTFTYIGKDVHDIYLALLAQNEKLVGGEELDRQVKNGKTFEKLGGKDVDTDDIEAVKEFLYNYANQEGSDLSTEAVQKRENDEEALVNLFTGLRENWYALDANTEALNQAKEIQQQISDSQNSILENARLGNTDAVVAQAKQYGVSDQVMDLYNGNIINDQDLAKIGAVDKEALDRGFDVEQVNRYAQELKKVQKNLSQVQSYQVALSNTRTNKGMEDLIDSYDEWTSLLDEDGNLIKVLDSESEETWSNMKKGVNDLLDTSADLSDNFFEDAKNMSLVKKAVEEGGDALAELRVAAAESIVPNVDDTQVKQALDDLEQYVLANTPNMEVGADMDISLIQNAFKEMMASGKYTAEQIQAYFDALGIDIEFEFGTEEKEMVVPYTEWQDFGGGHGMSITKYKKEKVTVPKLTGAKKGSFKGGNNKSLSTKKSGSGGSSKSEKTDTWENPYDELYNLTEKINESLRTREALERRYEKLVKKTASTVGEVTKAYYDQIRQLRTEADLQYQMQAGRARQLNNVGNEYYTDSEGNRSTFNTLGVTKYASYDQKTGLLQIDWSGLEALEGDPNKVEEGKAAEAYISRLEELQDQFEEVRDKLWDIEDQIEELREEAIENYLTFEDRVMDALVDSYQRQIDEYSTLSDQIKEQTDAIIKGIQDDVALSRQIRDNTKKEEDIADKEARLAYLRRDTSGANALEIKKLEDEIADARESYSDTMVDQQIQQLQDDANNAAEQRQHQIDIMQNQLDVAKENGTLWGEVWDLINTATAADGTFSQNTELVTLLEESEAYQSLSKIGQMKWWEEVAEAFKRARVGLSEAEDKYGVDANGDGKVTSSGTSSAISSTAAMTSTPASAGSAATSTTSSSSAVSTAGSGHFAKVGAYEHPMAQMPAKEVSELQQALNAAGFTDNDGKKLAVDGKYGSRTRAAVYKLQQKLGNVRVDGYYGPETRKATLQSQFKAYKTGGLADYTGPAWLDGSKTHPELVLNAKDTENFIELKNILAHSMGTQGAGGINNGDTYYEFNIDAEIGSDYDVEKLADKIKRLIYNDSSYRNINSINFTR